MRSLTEQAKAIKAGDMSSLELVDEALAAIERTQPVLNAFTQVFADEARKEATSPRDGPLSGVPIAIKEMYDVEGAVTSGCCAAYEDKTAQTDSAVVERLRRAGAIVVGKTNQHEMACGATTAISSSGPVRNAWDESRIPGGSSGGSGSAVAAGVVAMAMGSDTGGSVRIPSALCGVTGLKTTHGSISLRGAMALCPSLDTAGPLARTAEDCALIYRVLVGFDAADVWSRPSNAERGFGVAGAKIAILSRFIEAAHPEVRSAVEDCARALEGIGAKIDVVDEPDPLEGWNAAGPIFIAEFAASYPGLKDDPRVHPEVRALLEAGETISGPLYVQSVAACRAVKRKFESALTSFDALLAPSVAYAAPRFDDRDVDIGDGRTLDVHSGGPARLTMPVNVAGLPAVAFPIGFSKDGLPLGAQLIGAEWSELSLCAVVAMYQEATDFHLRRTP